jgi:hypothetical protein
MPGDYLRHAAARIRAVMADCTDARVASLLEELAKEFEERANRDRSRTAPGDAAPVTGVYAQLNAKGARTGPRIHAAEGEALPEGPPGFSWLFVRRQD